MMYGVKEEEKKTIQSRVHFFLLWCSNAYYNLKVYVTQKERRKKRKTMQKFIMMLYRLFFFKLKQRFKI